MGSTSFAIFRASELAKSELAGVTARMRQFSFVMNWFSMSRIWYSMSCGWSPTGTLVNPGRSTRVRLRTSNPERERGGRKRVKRGRGNKLPHSNICTKVISARVDCYHVVSIFSDWWGWWRFPCFCLSFCQFQLQSHVAHHQSQCISSLSDAKILPTLQCTNLETK